MSAGLTDEQWHELVSPLWAAEQMQLKCGYQRQPAPRAKLKYPNAIPTPSPLQQNFHILIQ